MSAPKDRLRSERTDVAADKVYGLAAARAVLEQRPADVIAIAHCPESRRGVAELLRLAARSRIAYREIPLDALTKLADSEHHEGICLRVRPKPAPRLEDIATALAGGGFALALDQVENPHNVGAIARSAAFFGARGLVVATARKAARLLPSSIRTAEGGAEHVPICFVSDLPNALQTLKQAGAQVIGADAHEGIAPPALSFPARALLVVGNERTGLTPNVARVCDRRVRIEGSGAVESLNVSVAAGVLMAFAANPRPKPA
jgi:TrmH RNA methyltransferase